VYSTHVIDIQKPTTENATKAGTNYKEQ